MGPYHRRPPVRTPTCCYTSVETDHCDVNLRRNCYFHTHIIACSCAHMETPMVRVHATLQGLTNTQHVGAVEKKPARGELRYRYQISHRFVVVPTRNRKERGASRPETGGKVRVSVTEFTTRKKTPQHQRAVYVVGLVQLYGVVSPASPCVHTNML